MIKRIGDITLIQLSDIDSNIYVIGDTVIDCGTGFNFTRMYDIIKMMKMAIGDFRQVINTHGHFDHIGGNGYFLNAKVAIHERDAPIIEQARIEDSMADFFDGILKPRQVDRKLKEGDKLTVGAYSFEVMHTPGHSPGSVCLYDAAKKILFSGDTIFADGVGRTDIINGDPDALASSLERISKLSVERLLPGHGDPIMQNAGKTIKEIISSPAESPPEGEAQDGI